MPTIVFASSKGGVGKSTTALCVAQSLARQGFSVDVLDADPNGPLKRWGEMTTLPDNMRVTGGLGEDNIYETIETASQESQFVVVDLEGSANLTVSYAITEADLVLIPMQGSQLDGAEAAKVIRLIERTGRQSRREIPYSVVITQAKNIKSRTHRMIVKQLADAGVPVLKEEMVERDAFRAVFSFGGFLHDLTSEEVSSPEKAVNNVNKLANEVLGILKERAENA